MKGIAGTSSVDTRSHGVLQHFRMILTADPVQLALF
jgi:hypothetical protein